MLSKRRADAGSDFFREWMSGRTSHRTFGKTRSFEYSARGWQTATMTRIFRNYLLGEILVIIAVPSIFRGIESRLIAGAVAGTIFVALGVWIVMRGLRDSSFRWTPTFIMGAIHLFGSALPLMITRLMNAAAGFEDVLVLGLPGPVFHQVSTGIFSLLMIATGVDCIRSYLRDRRAVVGK